MQILLLFGSRKAILPCSSPYTNQHFGRPPSGRPNPVCCFLFLRFCPYVHSSAFLFPCQCVQALQAPKTMEEKWDRSQCCLKANNTHDFFSRVVREGVVNALEVMCVFAKRQNGKHMTRPRTGLLKLLHGAPLHTLFLSLNHP